MKLTIELNDAGITGEVLAKRMFKLAWDACGRAVGMGVLQDRGPDVSEDAVWECANGKHDYPMREAAQGGKANSDYVFGRMMKLWFNYGLDFVASEHGTAEYPYRPDYQGFAYRYPTFFSLATAAAVSLRVAITSQSSSPTS